jgi:hypothetical protein
VDNSETVFIQAGLKLTCAVEKGKALSVPLDRGYVKIYLCTTKGMWITYLLVGDYRFCAGVRKGGHIMRLDEKWWKGSKDLWALDKDQRCKFMILLRGPFDRRELADLLGVKLYTIYGWEKRGQMPRLGHLRAMLGHFEDWYLKKGLPTTLSAALAEICQKKDLTTEKKPDKKATVGSETAD